MENTIEFIKEQKQATHPNYKKKCLYCGREFTCVRMDAKFCTPLCRVKYHQGKSRSLETPSNNGYKSFDFVCSISGYPDDKEWREFKAYLFKKFGWKRTDLTSFKAIKKFANNWNLEHDEQITLRKEKVRNGTHIIFSVN